MKHLQTLSFSILINSDQKTIWDTLWNPKTYPKWTSVFCLGNHYEGELKKGNTIQFLNGEDEGMTSLIEKMVEYEQIAFVHQAPLKEGSVNDFEWKGAREIYHLKKKRIPLRNCRSS